MSTPPPSAAPAQRRRSLLIGVGVGVLLPASSLLLTLLVTRNAEGDSVAYSVGTAVWSLLAFGGVLMIAFDRTRRLGLGILLGFTGLILVGAGTCTAVLMGGQL